MLTEQVGLCTVKWAHRSTALNDPGTVLPIVQHTQVPCPPLQDGQTAASLFVLCSEAGLADDLKCLSAVSVAASAGQQGSCCPAATPLAPYLFQCPAEPDVCILWVFCQSCCSTVQSQPVHKLGLNITTLGSATPQTHGFSSSTTTIKQARACH